MTEPTHEEQVAALKIVLRDVEDAPPGFYEAIHAILARLETDQWRPIEEYPSDTPTHKCKRYCGRAECFIGSYDYLGDFRERYHCAKEREPDRYIDDDRPAPPSDTPSSGGET